MLTDQEWLQDWSSTMGKMKYLWSSPLPFFSWSWAQVKRHFLRPGYWWHAPGVWWLQVLSGTGLEGAQVMHKPPLGRVNGFIIITQAKRKHVHPPQPSCCACYLWCFIRVQEAMAFIYFPMCAVTRACCTCWLIEGDCYHCSTSAVLDSHHCALWKQMSLSLSRK